MAKPARDWLIWGSELSPYALKLALCCRQAGLPHRFLPEQGGWAENWRSLLRVEKLKRRQLPLTWPLMSEDDEFPLVPYLLGPDGENLYDSTAIAEWLDRERPEPLRLIPNEPLAAFVARLIDDYADEWGLYLVHHQRWKVSARDNNAGARLAREYRFQLGPLQSLMASWFSARQTRRLSYLFSVAPEGFAISNLPKRRQPPSRDGFPATHALLEDSFLRLTSLLNTLLAERPYVLGARFTLADAALYGQLAMNLADPSTARDLQARTPTLYRWLTTLHCGKPTQADVSEPLQVNAGLKPLLAEIARVHLPLMQQNAAAYQRLKAEGQRRFNEAAFNAGQAFYSGVLDGQPFRSVVKSFQTRSWRDCCARWALLQPEVQAQVAQLMPGCDAFGTSP